MEGREILEASPPPQRMNVYPHLIALHLADFVISNLICMMSSQRYRTFNVNSQHLNINLDMLNYILPKGTILKLRETRKLRASSSFSRSRYSVLVGAGNKKIDISLFLGRRSSLLSSEWALHN